MASLRTLILSSVCVAGLASACSDSPTPSDASADIDVPVDAADAGDSTSPTDAAADTTPSDVGQDAATDATRDATTDAAADAAADVTSDVAPVDGGDAAVETVFEATLSGAQEVPSVASDATGTATITLNAARTAITYVVRHTLAGATAAHIHAGAPGVNGAVLIPFASAASEITGTSPVTPAQVADLESGGLYVNVHSAANPGGEIRGQVLRRGEELYVTALTNAQEVPRTSSAATGTASVILNPATATIHYRLATTAAPSAAHIHRGMAGVAGPVVYPLTPLGAAIDNLQGVTPADVAELRGGLFYVNVHTTANPGGEIRGQLLAPGSQVFVANLTGPQEVPPVTTASTGSAMVVMNYARTSVSVTLATTAVATAAHLHRGPGAVNGPVVIPLAAAGAFYTATSAVTPPDAALIESGGFYANVHTTANAGGEIRGQVLRPGEALYTAQLNGLNEFPPVVSTATGSAAMILSASGTFLTYTGVLTGITPTAAHIHNGAVATAGPVVYPLTYTTTTLGGSQTVTETDVTALNTSRYYVNVHTAANPGGEIRGQLARQ